MSYRPNQHRPSQTSKPCEGCGETGGRNAGQVCHKCKALMELGRQNQAKAVADANTALYRVTRVDGFGYSVPFRAESGPDERFVAALRLLSDRLAASNQEHYPGPDAPLLLPMSRHSPATDWSKGRYYPTDLAGALGDIDTAARELLKLAYAKGYADGNNLLHQLAGGHITAGDFNERTIKGKG